MRRATLVLALLVLAAIVTGVAASATKTAIPKQLIGKWERESGVVMVVGPRGEVKFSKAADTTTAGWYHAKFSHVRAHRLSVSGASCSGTGTYRWAIATQQGLVSWTRISFKKIHDACKRRVNLLSDGVGDQNYARIPRGARLNPVPLQQSWPVAGWTLRVTSVTPNADGQVIYNSTHTPAVPRRGAQFFMLDISVTPNGYVGSSSPLTPFSVQWSFEGSHNHKYDYFDDDYSDYQGCGPSADVSLPMPDLQPMIENNQPVSSGQSVSGNICVQVASHDATTLLFNTRYAGNDVWFSLH